MDKSVEQGEAFHVECLRALRLAGFEIADTKLKLADIGIELDAVTTNKHGLSFAWEFKGSWQGKRPGLKRTDTVKKAICNAWLLSVSRDYSDRFPPLFVMCSHEPEDGDGRIMLDTALLYGMITAVLDSRDGMRLQWFAGATEADLRRTLNRQAVLLK